MEGGNEANNGSVYWQARSSAVWERRLAAYCLLPLAYCLSVLQSVSVKADGNDPYEVFLSGPLSLITIENPTTDTEKELIIFRDSFGSAIAPLLAEGYRKVTLADIRYLPTAVLGEYIDFEGQDVLFLYSTLILNNSTTMK